MDKSTRINMQIRGHIQRRLKEVKFTPEEEKLAAEEPSIALNAYFFLYTEKERELLESLPKGFVREKDRIEVRVNGEYHSLNFALCRNAKEKSVFKRFTWERDTLYIKSNEPVAKQIHDWERRKKFQEEKRDEALRQAGAFISSHRTIAALLKAWPEVAEFLPADVETATTALALQVKQLNKMLGLP
jgi:hypothetical protein